MVFKVEATQQIQQTDTRYGGIIGPRAQHVRTRFITLINLRGYYGSPAHLCILQREKLGRDEKVRLGKTAQDVPLRDDRCILPFFHEASLQRCLSCT